MPNLSTQIVEDRGDKDFREWLTDERLELMVQGVQKGMFREALDAAYTAGRLSGITQMQEVVMGKLKEPIGADAEAQRSR
jgi:hypothetical protein